MQQYRPAKGTAFMRSTEDSDLHNLIPQMEKANLHGNIKNSNLTGQGNNESTGPPFCEGLSEKLAELVALCQQSHGANVIS